MNREEFIAALTEDIKQDLYERTGVEHETDLRKIDKLQNAGYEALNVKPEGTALAVSLNVSQLYEDYEQGRPYEDIKESAVELINQGFASQPQFNISDLMNYDLMKEKLSIQVVSTERNREMLETIPHREMEDMSMVCRFVVDGGSAGNGTILVTNAMLENFEITEQQLFDDAMKYAPDLRPSEIMSMVDIVAEIMGIQVEELENQFGIPSIDIPMYVASTPDRTNGAGILGYPGFFDLAAEKLEGEFCGLTLRDIDLENRTININHQLMRAGKKVYIETTKTTAGTRVIPMDAGVYECFKKIIENRKAPKVEPIIDSYVGFLYLDPKSGNPLVAYQWEKYFQHICEKYNSIYKVQMPKVTPHVCRHTYCSHMASSGFNPKHLQYLVGHSEIGVTLNTYTHVDWNKIQEEVAAHKCFQIV